MRVAGLKRQVAAGFTERTPDGLTAEDQLARIAVIVREQMAQHRHGLMHDVLPALAEHGVQIISHLGDLDRANRDHIDRYFQANVFPVLTPLAVDPGHPFPYISNLSLSVAVVLRGTDGEDRFARVKVPKILPRWVPCLQPNTFVPLEQVVGSNLEHLFPGIEILGWHLFRITRNTDIVIENGEEAEDLLSLIKEEVSNRRFAEVVRLEVHSSMPFSLRQLLLAEFNEEQQDIAPPLTASDVYEVHGLLDTADFLSLSGLDLPALKDPTFHPVTPARLAQGRNMFEVIREGDVLLHHPYDSFASTVERFIQAAADDPDVLAIKLTLYRTGGDSSIAKLLQQAAERGKQVAVLIELQARFDEENNIIWAQRLEDVGVHVSYGVAGLKTHAKVMLVVRREGDFIRRYVHIGTGNYNPKTARLYTDFGILSCDPGDRRRPHRPLQRPHRIRPAGPVPPDPRGAALHAGPLPGAHPPRDRAPARGTGRADPRQDERTGASRHHRGALRGLARRCTGRPHRAGHLLPPAGPPRRQREHPGDQPHRPFPRALARLLVPQRRAGGSLHRVGRLDAPQPRPAHRGRGADPRPRASQHGAGRPRAHVAR